MAYATNAFCVDQRPCLMLRAWQMQARSALQTLEFRKVMIPGRRHGSWGCPSRWRPRKGMQRPAWPQWSCPTPCASPAMCCKSWPRLHGLCEYLLSSAASILPPHTSDMLCAALCHCSNADGGTDLHLYRPTPSPYFSLLIPKDCKLPAS